ncbi:agglutination protein [Vibrio sp. SM6]|uniref:Agglutination protein n=1 Tax=Vibrio agarilyticus TaxID=2726741 RepID=A0A7X8YF72_9VIBR|nr:2OG-Fe dioxygenase family protein [Vibrio agarilyticus]NLS11364.1 agglutination protein [Vibrio agarilyticus]
MLHCHENTLHITNLSLEGRTTLAPSFFTLPHTEHADGQYRLRRYSVVTMRHGKLCPTARHEFQQSARINAFQGDVLRHFEPLEISTLQSDGFVELITLFTQAHHLPDEHEIEVHQIRIITRFDETPVAPEGVHQDGFDHIALVGIARHNIVGGEIMLYGDADEAPFFRKILEDGEVVFLADNRLWHNAQPIRAIKRNEMGYMDVFVLTAKAAS